MAAGYKTGGRTKGTPNRKNAEMIAAVEASGVSPLDYMLSVMRDPLQDYPIRLDAAKSAAPYVHSKLSAVEMTGKDGKDLVPESAGDDRQVARAVLAILRSGVKDDNA